MGKQFDLDRAVLARMQTMRPDEALEVLKDIAYERINAMQESKKYSADEINEVDVEATTAVRVLERLLNNVLE